MPDLPALKIELTEPADTSITLQTLLAFLFGSPVAIRQVAGSQEATWLGLVLVALAGFAREYDQESLLHAPWVLLVPLAASFALSLVLWIMCWRTTDIESWLSFLRCVWFCSPLAMLYAIPIERLGDELLSTQVNLASLGIVSLWRVLLAIRIVSVLRQISLIRAMFQIMWAVDTLVVVALFFSGFSLIAIMGGVRLSPAEQLLSEVQMTIFPIALFSWPVWMIGYFVSCFAGAVPQDAACRDSSVSRGMWWLVAAWFGLAIVGCLWAQPEQFRKHRVEQRNHRQLTLAINE